MWIESRESEPLPVPRDKLVHMCHNAMENVYHVWCRVRATPVQVPPFVSSNELEPRYFQRLKIRPNEADDDSLTATGDNAGGDEDATYVEHTPCALTSTVMCTGSLEVPSPVDLIPGDFMTFRIVVDPQEPTGSGVTSGVYTLKVGAYRTE